MARLQEISEEGAKAEGLEPAYEATFTAAQRNIDLV